MDNETIIMGLILNSGNAKCHLYTALAHAKEGEYDLLDKEMLLAEEALNEAHTVQTKYIQGEARGETTEITGLFVHAQDHLMTTMSEMTLIKEIIELRKEMNDIRK